ncbi:MAG: phage holin family protein [Clostridiales bacterium]|jgi:putative membrane protein|nr:phage holin family protein [Clostridiales bacterium]
MKKTVVNWLLSAALLYAIAWILPGFSISSFTAALVAALVLGLVNSLIKPIISAITLPITLLTLGLFSIVINALMLSLTSALVTGFNIYGFSTAIVASIVLSLLNLFFMDN